MIIFELSFPHKGSWNNKWSGEGSSHIIAKRETKELLPLVGRDFWYRWDDGWTAQVSVRRYSSTDPIYKKLLKTNTGFCGYNWMVDSIIRNGEIRNER